MKNHSKVLSAILAGSLAMGAGVSAVMADGNHGGYQNTSMQIRWVNGGVVTLVDGSTYTLPYGFDVSRLHPGERVAIVWTQEKNSAMRDATSISVL